MKKRIISLLCALLVFFVTLVPLGAFATEPESEEEPTLKELTDLADRASTFFALMQGSYSLWWKDMDKYGPLVETDQWMISLGYFSEESIETVGSELPPHVDRHTGEEYPKDVYKNTPARSLPKEITMERLKKDYFDLFYYDIYEFFSCGHEHVVHNQPGGLWCFNRYITEDADGRIFILAGERLEMSEIWDYLPPGQKLEDSAEILSRSDDRIVMAIYAEGRAWYETVEFRKNADGWRIYGGSAFYGAPPPETGDNTPILLTLTALSVFGLVALVVTVGRKKKERF